MSKKAPIRHIASPVPPITLFPVSSMMKNIPANAKDITIERTESVTLSRLVILGEWLTFRVGEEKGTLNTKVVIMKVTRPKYQSLNSVQTPRRLA